MTVSAPPRAVRPVPTVNVFAPVTEVAPLRLTRFVPVEKDVKPACAMSPVNPELPYTLSAAETVAEPLTDNSPKPFKGETAILPVVSPPIVRVLFAVV